MVDTEGLSTALVRGRFIAGVQDGPDPDIDPDAVPLVGLEVTLEPLTRVLTLPPASEGGRSTTMILSKFKLSTNDEGLLYNPEHGATSPDVRVVASDALSDDPDHYIRWRATITAADTGVPPIVKTFVALDGETIDLPTVTEVPDGGSVGLTEWMQLVADARAAKDIAVLAASQAKASATASGKSEDTVTTAAAQVSTHRNEVVAARDLVLPARDATLAARDTTLALGITVDTSVGTRVFVGDTMIHGDTGWRDVPVSVPGYPAASSIRIRRRTNMVDFYFFGNGAREQEAVGEHELFALPPGFRVQRGRGSLTAFNAYGGAPLLNGSGLYVNSNAVQLNVINAGSGDRIGATGSLPAEDPWPTSLPGTPS